MKTVVSRVIFTVGILLHATPSSAHDYDVVATGRCVYELAGVRMPVEGARVELRDQDFGAPTATDIVGPVHLDVSLNKKCGEATSGADGRFVIRARCGDLGPRWLPWTKPDLYVRCSLVGRAGRIFAKAAPFTLYSTATQPRRDDASPHDVGDVVLPTAPARAFLSVQQVYDRVRALIGRLPARERIQLEPVWVQFPGGKEIVVLNTDRSYFASYAGTVFMSIAPGDEANGTVAHEYGHTLHFQSFLKDWSTTQSVANVLRAGWQSTQHGAGKGHTLSTLSNPVMAYAEGFAEFMEGVMFGYSTGGLPNCDTWKELGANAEERISVEGNVACRLYRLYARYGLRDLWTAQARAKAVRYDHFFADFVKLHPEARAVAMPASAEPMMAVVQPPVPAAAAIRVEPLPVATPVPAMAAPAMVTPAMATPATSHALATRLGTTDTLRATLARSEGASCSATRATYSALDAWLRKLCPALGREPLRKQRCDAHHRRIARRASALGGLCH